MNNTIHLTAIIEPSVELGSNNYIGPYCYITGNTVIGNNNRFEAHCSIGTPAEHRDYFESTEGKVIIGNNNIFREYVTVNAGTRDVTTLCNNVVMLRGSHIGHDSFVDDKVNISCNVLVGGHSYLMEGCNFGLGSICHQFSVIGAYAMIGMGAVITKSSTILPGKVYVGSPAKPIKDNVIGLQRSNIDSDKLSKFKREYQKHKDNA
jgi:UDP-N-acetylglucosamine acyltransferase